MIIAIGIAGLVFGPEAAQGQIFEQLGLLGEAGAKSMQDLVENANRYGSHVAPADNAVAVQKP